MQHFFKNRQGFTLIELLVVIAIIGVLASVVLASLNSARAKGRDAARLSEVRQMQVALELAYSDNNAYPITSWTCSYQSTWQTSAFATGLEPYMPTLPTDPVNESEVSTTGGLTYCYYSSSTHGASGKWYMIVYTLESENADLEAQDGSTACSGHFFNYGGEDGYIITEGGNC